MKIAVRLAVLWMAIEGAWAQPSGQVAVIVNGGIKAEISRQDVVDVFLGRGERAANWQPIDSDDENLREQFYRQIAGISANRARAIWSRLVFSARLSPPREMEAAQAMVFILRNPQAIAYVPSDKVPKAARVLFVF